MNRNAIIGIVVVLVVLIGGFMLFQNMQNSNTQTPTPSSTDQSNQATTEPNTDSSMASSAATTGTVKDVTITGSNFKFSPSTITVNKGDTVKVTFANSGGMHNVMFDDFSAGSKTIQSGATDSFQFVADKTGTFQYYCSVGNHKAMGMVGTLTVQ